MKQSSKGKIVILLLIGLFLFSGCLERVEVVNNCCKCNFDNAVCLSNDGSWVGRDNFICMDRNDYSRSSHYKLIKPSECEPTIIEIKK